MEISIKTEPDPDVKPSAVSPITVASNSSLEAHTSKSKSKQHNNTLQKIKSFHCSECFTTKQLTESFSSKSVLNRHIKEIHVRPAQFQCELCFKVFKRSYQFTTHKRTHSQQDVEVGDTTYKCDLCSKIFLVKNTLVNHLFDVHKHKHEGVKYFQCEFCSKEFRKRSKLESHVVNKHVVDKEIECPVCSKNFIDQEALEKHRKGHDREITHFCDVCSKGFRSKDGLMYHLKAGHNILFYCTKCLRSFSNQSEFDEHFNPKTAIDFKCGICFEILNSQCLRDIHTNYHLKEIKVEKDSGIKINKFSLNQDQEKVQVETLPLPGSTQEPVTLLRCELCLKSFDREDHLRAHRKQVHPKAEWTCERCSKTFSVYCRLKQHRKMHLREIKSFVCPDCPEAFSSSQDLAKHEESHTLEETEHKCKICYKYFKSSRFLTRHRAKEHGGGLKLVLKPFKCPVEDCGTSWSISSRLKTHLVSHQTEKLFKCELCTKDKAFKTICQLTKHQRIVHSKDTKKNN